MENIVYKKKNVFFIFIFLFIMFITFRYFFSSYVIITESMVPTINVNDAVIIKKVSKNDINIGDIITFNSDGLHYNLPVTHRVVGKYLNDDGSYYYETKGDNNKISDLNYVNLDDVYGKVIFTIPKLGTFRNFIISSKGFYSMILIPTCFLIIYIIFNFSFILKK